MNQEIISALENSLLPDVRQVIFVCGLGGAGKTEFCDALKANFSRESIIVRSDWYLTYSSRERRERIQKALNVNDPEATEREGNPEN